MTEFSAKEWEDITPIPQNDGPNPVVSIAYTPEFTRLHDIFRGVVARRELSERVLHLTEELLELNPANYTVWQYRRQCLKKLSRIEPFQQQCKAQQNREPRESRWLVEELEYMDAFADDNPKNYQIWHHRRTVVDWLGDGSRELAFCAAVFQQDAKNYHAWAHRQWALQRFGLWAGELDFIEQCIREDVRNNSAWNQRWFYVHCSPDSSVETSAEVAAGVVAGVTGSARVVSAEVLWREVQYASDRLAEARHNESAWNYLRGLVRLHSDLPLELRTEIKARCKHFISSSSGSNKAQNSAAEKDGTEGSGGADSNEPEPLAMALLADISEWEGCGAGAEASDGAQASLRRAEELCVALVSADPLRAKNWTRRAQALRQRIALHP